MLDDLPLTPPVPLWNDLMLRFASEQEATEQLLAAGLLIETHALLDADEQVIQPAGHAPAPGASIDTVGVIYKPTGEPAPASTNPQINKRIKEARRDPTMIPIPIIIPQIIIIFILP